MIVTKITSGLGNQLFQYAIAKNLALQNNTSLYFDLSYYKSVYATDTIRNFKLQHLNIDYKILNDSPLVYLSKATKFFPNRTCKPFFQLVKEKHFHFNDQVFSARAKCVTLDGFWQSEKYFADVSDSIRKDLTFKNNGDDQFEHYKKEILNTPNAVSLHVRRGDYVSHPEFSKSFGFIGLDYYKQAMAYINSSLDNFRFFVFSDDKEWVRENLEVDSNTVFIENTGENSDIADLQLMSLCRHNVIANSSFSWWGAWLNDHKNKVVISPAKWYKNKPDWNTKDLLPGSWIKL